MRARCRRSSRCTSAPSRSRCRVGRLDRRSLRPPAGVPRRRDRRSPSRRALAALGAVVRAPRRSSRVAQAASGALISTSSAALDPRDDAARSPGRGVRHCSTCSSRRARRSGRSSAACSSAGSAGARCSCSRPARDRRRRRSSGSRSGQRAPAATAAAAAGAGTPRSTCPASSCSALAIVAFLVALARRGGDAARASRRPSRSCRSSPLFVAIELRHRPAGGRSAAVRSTGRSPRPSLGVFGATVILHGSFILVPLLVEQPARRERRRRAGSSCSGIAGVGAIVAPFGGRISDRRGRRRRRRRRLARQRRRARGAGAPGAAGRRPSIVAVLLGVVGLRATG